MRPRICNTGPPPQPFSRRESGSSPRPPLSLYIHVPWCVRKCPYCDFNSHGLRSELPVREYVAALMADLEGDLADFGAALDGRAIASVFFGGGTPSLMPPDAIAAILDGAKARLRFAHDCEITLETNPGTVEHGRFDGYLAAGVNRISFGVQSFDDEMLRALGRIHSAAEAEAAVKLAQDAGYDNINLDLMYALPKQRLEGALADVERALALRPAHVSHYQLTLEPGTPFARRPPPLPDDDAAWDMQEACQARLAAAGFTQYEVSAYARDGRRCRHNLNYWEFGDYLAIGAGAHGKITGPHATAAGIPLPPEEGARLRPTGSAVNGTSRPDGRAPGTARARAGGGPARPRDSGTRTPSPLPLPRGDWDSKVRRRWKVRSPRAYLQAAATPRRIGGDETVAAEQLPFEFMLNALRLDDGIAAQDFTARTGLPLSAIDAPLGTARDRGWLVDDPAFLKTTPLGRRFLNDVIASFLPEPARRYRHA